MEEEEEEEEEEQEEDDYRLLSVRALDGEFQKSASRDGEGEGVLAGDDENQSLQMLSLLASEASVSMNAPLGAPRRAAAAASATTAAAAPSQAQATAAAAEYVPGVHALHEAPLRKLPAAQEAMAAPLCVE